MSAKDDIAFLTGYFKEVIQLAKADAEAEPERYAEVLVREGFARRPGVDGSVEP